MDNNVVIPSIPPLYKFEVFPEISRQAILMMFLIIGHDDDRFVDEAILGFILSVLPPMGVILQNSIMLSFWQISFTTN